LLKSSTFIRSLHMHLYWSNINLKIDIPYSLPLLYIKYEEGFNRTACICYWLVRICWNIDSSHRVYRVR